jgi:hypothetical protein
LGFFHQAQALLAGALIIGVAIGFTELRRNERSVRSPMTVYPSGRSNDPVSALNFKLQAGHEDLKFEGPSGYLRDVLEALNVPIESQLAVFSKTSLQSDLIGPHNPRTIFFNDSVAVAWVRKGFIELAAQDPVQGVTFYTLDQQNVSKPTFKRRIDCLRCHVDGMLVRSTFTAPDGAPRSNREGFLIDDRSPIENRWGGWYVTGSAGPVKHMGNAVMTDSDIPRSIVNLATFDLPSLRSKFDTRNYLSPYSDIAALMVFDHQMYMTNLITRIRHVTVAVPRAVGELVDYMLFVNEAPLAGKMKGTSGFAEKFAMQGPRDSKGRSLRDLDLERRLLRYPCSYMIYSAAFDGLSVETKDAVYRRMWQVLSGADKDQKYARLALADRRAIVEILHDTKPEVRKYFQPVTH